MAWMLLLEAAASACSSPSTCSCSSCSSRSCSSRCTSSSAGGATSNRVYAALKFFLFTMVGSALMLVGMLALVFLTRRPPASSPSTSSAWPRARRWPRPPPAGCSWPSPSPSRSRCRCSRCTRGCPTPTPRRPPAGSVILAGVLLKMGTYGLLRFGALPVPEGGRRPGPVLLTLGVIGIIYGAIVATMQKDLKRLVAYSSVAHLGFIVLGTFACHQPGHRGRRAADGEPRPLHRRAVPPRRHDLRPPPHPPDRRARRAAEVGAGAGRGVHRRDAVVGRPARPQRFRRRVPRSSSARSSPIGGGRSSAPSGVILAAVYLLWAYQRVFHGEPDGRQRHDARHEVAGAGGHGAAGRCSSCSSACTPSRCSIASTRRSTGWSTTWRQQTDFDEPAVPVGRRSTCRSRGRPRTATEPMLAARRSTRPTSTGALLAPELILIGGALILLVVGARSLRRRRWAASTPLITILAGASLVGTVAAVAGRHRDRDRCPPAVADAVAIDGFAVFFMVVICVAVDPRRPAGRRLPAPRGSTGPSSTS